MTLRYRSEGKVVHELEGRTRKHGIVSGQLFANDILARRERLEELIIQMEKRKIRYNFVTFGRADTVVANKDLLPRLAKIGLVMFWVGVESLDQEILDHVAKGTTTALNREALAACEEANIPVVGPFYMFGFPQHTVESIRAQRSEALRVSGRFSPGLPAYIPTPGTPMYFEVARKGLIEMFDYSQWDVGGAVARTEHMSRDEINRESRKFGLASVFRPSFIIGQLRNGTVHGVLQAFLGPSNMINMLAKKLLGLKNRLVRFVKRILFGPDELEAQWEAARLATISYAEARAARIASGDLRDEQPADVPEERAGKSGP